ncbi:MAG: CoA pyrophosphatase [Candidatus Competibacteraceae bacterium]
MSDPFAHFVEQLRCDLSAPLPGQAAQHRMAPRPRSGGDYSDTARPDTRQGGVLALFYPTNGRVHLALILRPTYSGVHSGQVGLPGGGREEADADLAETALREAHEEIGIDPAQVTVLGQLTPIYVFASTYLVQPVVGWTARRPNFHLDPYEVALLIETSLDELLDEANRRNETWQLRGHSVEVPYFLIQGQTIWGATAMMLSELLSLPAMQTASGAVGSE